jgi:hypothetical protein
LKKKDQNNVNKNFIVNRQRVQICLKFLCDHNPLYKASGIKMDDSNINKLPINGIPLDINELVDDEATNVDFSVDKGPEIDELESNDIEFEVL